MASDDNQATGRTQLFSLSSRLRQEDAESTISSHVSQDEQLLGSSVVGERLPYNDYSTIDWLHDLVKDSFRHRAIHSRKGFRYRLLGLFDACEGWVAAALIGTLTACVASIVDLAVATVSDWKSGYCQSNLLAGKAMCCTPKSPLLNMLADAGETCPDWHSWSTNFGKSFAIYTGWALLFGIISGAVTMTTKRNLPAAAPGKGDRFTTQKRESVVLTVGHSVTTDLPAAEGKSIYMAAGSGIPEIKTILSGFVIPHFLDLKILVVKAVGSIFAVSSGMNLGKEGPFVHISTCVAYLVAVRLPKYRDNGRKLREMLSAGCASGLSVAFGAPIGGVLFAYEEISTYFPRKVLWRAFVCSLFAAMVLRAFNPTGTGKLVLFETDYGTTYKPYHYFVFILLGLAGGVFGGTFCKLNFLWSRTFRQTSIIKNHPVLEVCLVVLATSLLQYPNPITREPGDVVIKNLLVDCDDIVSSKTAYVCLEESDFSDSASGSMYIGWLIHGTLVKLLLTIITFGVKVPSGVIIPALDAGAFFGRLIGQLPWLSETISPGIFAMVGAGAFLAGVSRMTISLAVIMFELTGELEFIVPNMVGIMVAKWVADYLEKEGVYDLAQTVLGHPFLDPDGAIKLVQQRQHLVGELIPPEKTMKQITVEVPTTGVVSRKTLEDKLEQLKLRGLMDAGLVLVHAARDNTVAGYLSEGELEFGLTTLGASYPSSCNVRLLGMSLAARSEHPVTNEPGNGSSLDGHELDMSIFVDRTPLTVSAMAPMEYAVELFTKLGLRYLCVTEQGSGRLVGVIIKKRMVSWLDSLKHGDGDDDDDGDDDTG